MRDVIIAGDDWQEVAGLKTSPSHHDLRGAASNTRGEVFFADVTANKIYRIGPDGKMEVFVSDAGHANSLSVGAHGELYAVSRQTGKVMRYESSGKGQLVTEGLPGEYVLVMPNSDLYVTSAAPGSSGIWLVKDGKKSWVAAGPKRATGMAYRPDQWLLSVADGNSKWVYSFQIQPDGGLTHPEQYFWLHVRDADDDTGGESVCYAREGQMLVATRMGVQICADDGPTQVILPLPDRHRVVSLCLGGPDGDMLFAFSSDKIWKRKVKIHGIGAFTPWLPVNGSPL